MRHRSRDANAPEFCENVRWVSREAAQPTLLSGGFRFALPTLRSYEAKRKKEAERRQTCSANLRILRYGALQRVRSPIGVPLRLLPSGLSALGRNSRPGFLGRGRTFDPVSSPQPGSEDLAFLRGRYPRPPVPVQGTHLPDRS